MTPCRLVAVLLTAMLAFGACGGEAEPADPGSGSGDSQATTEPAEEAATTSPEEEEPAGTADAGNLDVEFTPAGTELEVGEKAVVPFVSDGPAAIGIALTAIRKGQQAELAPLELGEQVSGMTPYYLQVEVTNESGTDLSFSSAPLLSPLLGDGSPAQRVSVIGEFPPCDYKSAGKDFTGKGDTFRTCILALASGSAQVTGMEFSSPPQEEIAGSPDYLEKPLVWQK